MWKEKKALLICENIFFKQFVNNFVALLLRKINVLIIIFHVVDFFRF